MKKLPICLFITFSCSLFSKDGSFYSAILLDQTQFKSQNISGIYTAGSIQIPWTNTYQPRQRTGFGFSFGYTTTQYTNVNFEFESTYRTKNESTLQFKNRPDLGRYSLEYFTIGITARFNKIYGLGIGIDFRREILGVSPYSIPGSTNPPEATQTVHVSRPWATISYEHSYRNFLSICPFISIRACYALTSHKAPSGTTQSTTIDSNYITNWTQDFARSLAPTFQIAFQSGLRF